MNRKSELKENFRVTVPSVAIVGLQVGNVLRVAGHAPFPRESVVRS